MTANVRVEPDVVELYVKEGLERRGYRVHSVKLRSHTSYGDRPWESDVTTVYAEADMEIKFV